MFFNGISGYLSKVLSKYSYWGLAKDENYIMHPKLREIYFDTEIQTMLATASWLYQRE